MANGARMETDPSSITWGLKSHTVAYERY